MGPPERLPSHHTGLQRLRRLWAMPARLLSARSKTFLSLFGLVLVVLIGLLDYATGPLLVLSVFYVIPIAIVSWYVSIQAGAALSCVSAATMLAGDLWTRFSASPGIPAWNAVVRLGFFLLIVWILKRRKATEEKLQTLMHIKTEFTSMVSHELRTPLSSITEGLAMLLEETAGPLTGKQQQYLEIVQRNVDRLARLVTDVLDDQKLEAGRMDFVMEPCDVGALVASTVSEFVPVASKRGLELRADVTVGLPAVLCDRDKIVQVLSNLLDNAIKFTERGCIRVAMERLAGRVRVAVCDQGPGVQPADCAKLFHGFVQLVHANSRSHTGTGLGLAISKKIIERHRGQIGIESAPDEGAVFYFTLPLEENAGGPV